MGSHDILDRECTILDKKILDNRDQIWRMLEYSSIPLLTDIWNIVVDYCVINHKGHKSTSRHIYLNSGPTFPELAIRMDVYILF